MFLALTFFIPPPPIRSVRTRVFNDPVQYDVEINAARGFTFPKATKNKTKSKKIKPTIKVDPAQFDVEENLERHLPNW
tara:strand:- start:305 stop:538 length:234 start_codon:yes stop_codon:yes gene_type:complete